MADPVYYGTDVSTFAGDGPEGPDLDPNFAPITGARAIGESVLRGWIQLRGSLIEDPDDGEAIHSLLNARMTESLRQRTQQALASSAQKDERVSECAVLITLSDDGKIMQIRGVVFPADGTEPFTMIVDAKNLTLDVLKGIR